MDRRNAARFVLIASLSLLAVVSLGRAAGPALAKSDDLARRAEEVRLFLAGSDPYDDPDMTYPPTALPILLPLIAPFGERTLRTCWLGLNLLALAGLGWTIVTRWGKIWPTWLKLAFVLVVAASKPARVGIELGQFHLIPTLLVLLAVRALDARRPIAAGLFLGLALAKPTMVLPFLGLLAVRRHWRALATAGLFQGLALLLVSARLGIGPLNLIREWLEVARGQEAAGMIDLPSLAVRFGPIPTGSASQIGLAVLAASSFLTFVFRRKSDLGLLGLAGFMSAIFTYHRPYDLVLLFPALAYLLDVAVRARDRSTTVKNMAAITFATLLLLPSNPHVTGQPEIYHHALFVVIAYLILATLLGFLTAERNENPEAAGATLGAVSTQRSDVEAGQFARASS